jgi:ATP-dependent helicase/nuclease subunit B
MIYSIPFSSPFLGTVADYLLNQTFRFPLSVWTIYLPTRRACNSLEAALFEKGGGKALILPRIVSLGDIEPEEMSLLSLQGAEEVSHLPPIISESRRRLLLASLIEQFQYGDQTVSFHQALIWAESLTRFIDELRSEGIDLNILKNVKPVTGQAEHWQEIHKFLTLVGEHWDAILGEEKRIEPVVWQKRLVEIQADLLEKKDPEVPVMIAGSLGTISSTVRLIQVVSRLKNGVIILPGLEKRQKNKFSLHHPQFFLHRLLKKLETSAEEIKELGKNETREVPVFLEKIFDPQFLFQGKASVPVSSIEYVEASDQGEEARIIGLSIRKAIEEGKKKILCISPDQELLRRVSEELEFWEIVVCPAQSKTLLETKTGSFLYLITLWFSKPFPSVAMASTFKHSFVKEKKRIWTLFERYILRTWVGHHSVETVSNRLEQKRIDFAEDTFDQLMAFWASLKSYLSYRQGGSLGDYLAHMEVLIGWILDSDKKIEDLFLDLAPEEELIFQTLWQDLKKSMGIKINHPQEVSHILLNLLKGHKIPHTERENRNIFLMSPSEARFMDADFTVLAGVNEGKWPADPISDPFFSASMRQALNLPSLESRVSQSAHDFLSCICRPCPILITRSLRAAGVPSVPSRFLSYLETALEKRGLELPQNPYLKEWAKSLIPSSQKINLKAPRPSPLKAYRPKRLSITDISLLMNDPYSVYAKHILKLKKLESFNTADKPRLFGIFVHDFLHRWRSIHQVALDTLALGRAKFLFELYLGSIDQSRFWWERFLILLEWMKRQKSLDNISTEVKGEFCFAVGGDIFTLFGKADRIDWNKESAILIDYKTGPIPSLSNIRRGQAPQMPLEALIFLKGQFSGVPRLPLKDIQYWGLLSEEIISLAEDLPFLVDQTQKNLERLVGSFYNSAVPYLSHPKGLIQRGAYDHLARVQEWYAIR